MKKTPDSDSWKPPQPLASLMKRFFIPLLLLLFPLVMLGQQTINAELLGAVNRYLASYRSPENYVPKDAMVADSVRVDEA